MLFNNKPMMYPEPAATGNGSSPDSNNVNSAPPSDADVSLFTDALKNPVRDIADAPAGEPPADGDYLLDFADVGYTEAEKQLFSQLGKKHGLDAGQLSSFARELKSELDACNVAAQRELLQEWGPRAKANANRIGLFLQQVSRAFNWPAERMEVLNNASVFRVMHDIVSYVSGNKPAAGLNQASAAAPAKTKAELKTEMNNIICSYYDAVNRGDEVAMAKFAHQHSDIVYALTGKREMQLLDHF